MSVIAPRDTTTRYKSLFSFGKRRFYPFFFTGYPKDRDLTSIIPQDGDAEWRTTALRIRDYITFARSAWRNFQRGELKRAQTTAK